ncbi:hypothetical protein RvY_13246 [Ramazzottius varieornatus]|uniref:Uncharacterized protein n=1 Tax=Ramazzottius varieornatus TaxID=947166 RepID=A0A1D1VPF7_RAMVA|nr:hypothetical protein RvY_13246 [Ramazzottius varieornatus]
MGSWAAAPLLYVLAVALCVVSAILAAPSSANSADVLITTELKLVTPHVGCYVFSESLGQTSTGAFKIQDIQPDMCTYIVYGFATIQANELQITPKDEENLFNLNALKVKNPELHLFLALDAGNQAVASQISQNLAGPTNQNRQDFVTTIVEKLRVWSVDGIAVHLESLDFPTANPTSLLLKDIRTRFEQEAAFSKVPRLVLLVKVGNNVKASIIDPRILANASDIVQVRAFDYHTPEYDPAVTDSTSPLYKSPASLLSNPHAGTIETTFSEWEFYGVPKTKLVLGVALYGRAWTLQHPLRYEAGAPAMGPSTFVGRYLSSPGRLAYHDICQLLSSRNLTRVFDSYAMAPYAHGNQTKMWVSYDDTESVRIKSRWVMEKGYGGVVFWDISLDDFNATCSDGAFPLVKAARSTLAPSADVLQAVENRVCNREFCMKKGGGVFALGTCNNTYCSCDFGGIFYKFNCGPTTIFDPLTLACNFESAVKGCTKSESASQKKSSSTL